MLDPYSQVRDTAPTPTSPSTTTGQAAAQINRSGALERLRALLGPSFGTAPVTTDYGFPAALTGNPHTGIDLAAAEGAPIQEPIGGTVERVWSDSVGGNQVAIKTPQGYREVYAHLAFIPAFVYNTPGAGIPQGGIIGYVGHTGQATGSHLHYEVTKPSGAIGTMAGTVDPLAFIGEFANATAAGKPNSYTDPLTAAKVNADLAAAKASNDKGVFGITNPLDPLGAIAGDIGRLTGDLTNPQTWARLGLTAAAVGLIISGMVLYAGSAVHQKVSV